MNKKIVIGLLVIAGLVTIGYGQFWLRYYWATEESNKETTQTKCNDGIGEEFTGTIKKIERFEYSDFMNKNFFALEIRTNDSLNNFRTYQFSLEPYRDVLDFAKSGQVITKKRGQNNFTLKTDLEQQKSFVIPDCKLIEE